MKNIFIFLLSFFLISCQKNTNEPLKSIPKAFYYWKTNFSLSKEEISFLKKYNIQKLYIRIFDVDFDFDRKEPVPISPLEKIEKIEKIEFVPVIFITNRTLRNITPEQAENLAVNIYKKVRNLWKKIDFQEIQLDCDWTAQTRIHFFKLLGRIKNISQRENKKITSTLRLHQVKFAQKEGIPPVKETSLMLYNMGNLHENTTENSIFELKTANSYLDNFEKYPLEVNWALPLFSWTVLKRNNKVINLINDWQPDTENYEKIKENQYKVIKSHYKNNQYLYKDDELRVENIKKNDLQKIIQLLQKKRTKKPPYLIFYHLDKNLIQKFDDFFEEMN